MNVRLMTRAKLEIGQVLIIGFDATEMTPRLRSLLTRIQPAGVVLFARNIKSAEQTRNLLRDCQKCVSTRLFTCVDLEGGTVDRLRDVLGAAPSAAEVFATGDDKVFRQHGQIIGENCRALGFNVDFAPVVDLGFEASHKVLGSRVVSADPRQTVVYAREFLAGLRKAGVLGCGKHFPGLGEGRLDSHRKLPVIEKPLKKLWNEDLLPYRRLRAQVPMVMVAHAAYPQVTKDHMPASLSKIWITDVLRRRIGYRNLIVSDDLEMGGVLSVASVGEAAVANLRAGGDMLLVCHHEQHVWQAFDELGRAEERDAKIAARVHEAARRVLAFKKKSAKLLRSAPPPSIATVEKLSRKLWEFSERVRLEALQRGEDDGKNLRRRA